MARKLSTYVHAVEYNDKDQPTGRSGTFGPDDDLPDWAEKSITNPDVWADSSGDDETGEKPAPRRTPASGPTAKPAK